MEQENTLLVQRNKDDRRVASRVAPPYLTEEGIVMIDRREGNDRRGAPIEKEHATQEKDLVLERLKRLVETYGYLQPIGKAVA